MDVRADAMCKHYHEYIVHSHSHKVCHKLSGSEKIELCTYIHWTVYFIQCVLHHKSSVLLPDLYCHLQEDTNHNSF